jgi:hypothetical protein
MELPDLKNATTARVEVLPQIDVDGRLAMITLVKQRFAVSKAGRVERVPGAEIRVADVPWDPDAPMSSIKYPTDLCLRKPATDVVIVGAAQQRDRRPVPAIDVMVRAAGNELLLRVHGPRVWYQGAAGLALSRGEPFESLWIKWEDAFGGHDATDTAKPPAEDARNPAGKGIAQDPATLVHQPGPRIEEVAQPIASPKHRAPPAGIGAIGRHYEPRRRYAGTYDETWMKERMPLPPFDFDDRFNQSATPRLIMKEHLRGGEEFELHNLTPHGPIRFLLPSVHWFVGASIDGRLGEHPPALDTIVIEPGDQTTFDATWRSTIGMPRPLRRCAFVQVHEKRAI